MTPRRPPWLADGGLRPEEARVRDCIRDVVDAQGAAEALVSAGLAPCDLLDPSASRRRWCCRRCWGYGRCAEIRVNGRREWWGDPSVPPTIARTDCDDLAVRGGAPCTRLLPGAVDDFAAWCSFGASRILRAELLARDLDAEALVVWSLRTTAELRAPSRFGDAPVTWGAVFAHETQRSLEPERWGGVPAWPEACPYDAGDVRRAWPVLREVAGLGVHLLDWEHGFAVTFALEIP